MAFRSSYFANNLNRNLDESNGLPVISQNLDAVRQYQFEVTFNPPPGVTAIGAFSNPLTIACKKVGALGMAVKPIEVRRVNDVVNYPGQVSYQEVEFTFDNLLVSKTGKQLYDFMTTVFDPTTGEYGTAFNAAGLNSIKSNIEVYKLDGKGDIQQVIKLKGAFPTSFMQSEAAYNGQDFDTCTMKFKYDYLIVEGDPTA